MQITEKIFQIKTLCGLELKTDDVKLISKKGYRKVKGFNINLEEQVSLSLIYQQLETLSKKYPSVICEIQPNGHKRAIVYFQPTPTPQKETSRG